MKLLLATLSLIFAISATASSETRTFTYDGSQDSVEFLLRAEETHTEYRYEQRQSICYRQQVYYRTICESTPRGRHCRQVPYYRTVSYPCLQTIRIPYEVKDFDVEAKVNISIKNLSGLAANESFKVHLNGDRVSLSANGSKKFFIILKKSQVKSNIYGRLKMIDGVYSVELVEAAPIVKAISVSSISMARPVLSFKTGVSQVPELIGYHLQVLRSPLVGSDTVLFGRELSSREISLNTQGQNSVVSVNLQDLGIDLGSGRYKLTAKALFKYDGTILNHSQFDTEGFRTLLYKIR